MTYKDRVIKYCENCISGKIPSGQKHIWACERFIKDLDRIGTPDFPYIWDEEEAKKIVEWFKLLKHSKGVLAGTPKILTDWEMFRECQIYGWRHRETGLRRFKKAFTEVARKNAKSQLEAGEALYELAVTSTRNHEVNEIYTAGVKREQSKIVFKECDLMTKGSVLRSKFIFRQSQIEHIKSGSVMRPLSKEDGKSGDGTNPAMLIIDEYHQHPTTDFYDLALGSNTKESLLSIITTAGKDLSYPCYTQEYDYCSKLLDPNVDIKNDEYFVDICEANPEDDPGALETWIKANPIRATYPEGIKKIREDYEVAKQVPEKMISFMTKMLNIWVQAKNNGYMDMAKWKACEVKELPIDITGRPVYVGFDMSSKIDLTSVAFVIPFEAGFASNGNPIVKYIVWTHSFIPNAAKLREHIMKDRVPYDAWERLGYLTVTNTPIVDQSAVMAYVLKECERYDLDIQCLCFDPANASKMMLDLSNEGYDVEEVYQSHKSLNEATQGFREQVYAGNILYLHNPLLNYSMSNAVIRTSNGLIKIDKDASTKRIDPVDAMLGAFKLAAYHDFSLEKYGDYVDRFLDEMEG
ncbi:MAG: terminase large subunit [Eubacterium sp.]|nr:terminase large subunit [Candidatus Colimonas fimequi]